MRALLPRSFSIADANQATPTLTQPAGVGTVDTRTAQTFIDLASQEIDSRLAPVYLVPLQRIKVVETELVAPAKRGATSIMVYDNGNFNRGGIVRLRDDDGSETNEVDRTPEATASIRQVDLVAPLGRDFSPRRNAVASVVEYPDPIPAVCARLAVSMIIDRQFVSDQSPDVSNYGKTQRTLANASLDMLISGVARLEGQEHTGRRFVRASLRDAIRTAADFQPGGGKEA